MSQLKGVYLSNKLDGSIYYRASFTFKNKHISLGSYNNAIDANSAYNEALTIAHSPDFKITDFEKNKFKLPYDKYISIINYRDNNIYIKNPIYIKPKYFEYYLDSKIILKFDVDDLFYYSNHKIMKRNNHLFVSDYGMQVTILSRYGIKNYSIADRDYLFINGDNTDLRYSNIKIINRYVGVSKEIKDGREIFIAKIHINGDYIIGKYNHEYAAAIAYNKAIDILSKNGFNKNFMRNYIEDISSIEYASHYNAVRISKKIRNFNLTNN